jgi:hypothetical protein
MDAVDRSWTPVRTGQPVTELAAPGEPWSQAVPALRGVSRFPFRQATGNPFRNYFPASRVVLTKENTLRGGTTVKVFFGFGFTVRLAIFCLLAGMAVGLFLGASAASPERPAGTPAATVPVPDMGHLTLHGGG